MHALQVQARAEVTGKQTQEVLSAPKGGGIYIGGLVLEGAEYDMQSECLVENRSRATQCAMPAILVNGFSTGGVVRDSRAFSCPVYQFPQRGAKYHILSVDLRSDDAVPDRWVLQGVAMIGDPNLT